MARKKTKSKSKTKRSAPKKRAPAKSGTADTARWRTVHSHEAPSGRGMTSHPAPAFSPIRPSRGPSASGGGIPTGMLVLIGISAVVAVGAAYVTRPRTA